MKPGRELDALVAEKVMGCIDFVHYRDGAICAFFPSPIGQSLEVPEYSTDIAAAWTVDKPGWLWKFQEAVGVLSVTLYISPLLWHKAIKMYPVLPEGVIGIRRIWLDDKARTYAWLRCLAALEALGVEVGDD